MFSIFYTKYLSTQRYTNLGEFIYLINKALIYSDISHNESVLVNDY